MGQPVSFFYFPIKQKTKPWAQHHHRWDLTPGAPPALWKPSLSSEQKAASAGWTLFLRKNKTQKGVGFLSLPFFFPWTVIGHLEVWRLMVSGYTNGWCQTDWPSPSPSREPSINMSLPSQTRKIISLEEMSWAVWMRGDNWNFHFSFSLAPRFQVSLCAPNYYYYFKWIPLINT